MKRILTAFAIILFAFITSTSFSQEICNNGIDDDTDGLIDLNDTTDCSCSGISGGGGGPIPSLIPNPSFETTNCCPSSYSELGCATSWVQASDATSDYFNCGFNFGAATSLGITAPDGNGYVGAIVSPGYVEYIGSCLSSPLIAGTSYTFQMQIAASPIDGFGDPCNGGNIFFSPLELTYFGSTDCNNLPYSGYDCPTSVSGWQVLGSTTYTPSSTWGVVTVTFTPSVNINAIIFGSSCTIPADYSNACYPYFYFDNLLLNNSGYFNGMQIGVEGGLCTNDLILTASLDTTGGTWQWYDEGIAIAGQNDSIFNVSQNGTLGGNYSAVYTVGTDCIRGDYTVTNPVIPAASFTNTNICEGEQTNFTNNSTISSGTITNFEWNFDDGNSSTLEDPTNNYTNPGSYDVELIITSNQGCKDTISQSVDVFEKPNANFNTSSVCEGETMNFTDASTAPSPLSLTNWSWLVNGNSSTNQNPNFVMPSSGTISAQLIVTNSAGCTDTIIQSASVFDNPTANFSHQFHCLGSNTLFTDLSNVALPQTITGWEWSIDGDIITSQNTSYVFDNVTSYPVTLTVTSSMGCESEITNTVTILQVPNAEFDFVVNCSGNPILFENLSTILPPDMITYFEWVINGDTLFVNDPTIPFQEDPTYTASLLVVADNGCTDSITKNIVQCTELNIPNIFSPNGDNQNEFFYIDGLFGENNHLIIFNRWGQIVYENANYLNNWDANDVVDGTYYYILHSNLEMDFTGFVSVLR